MRRYLTVSILLLGASFACGAHFEYYAGGFSASCYNYSEDYYYISGPFTVSETGSNDVVAEDYSAVLQANTIARNSVITVYGGNSVHFRAFSLAASMSLDTYGYGYCYGSTTTEDGQTLGIFYEIVPDTNENIGDDVIVNFTGTLSIEPTGLIPGSVTGYLEGPGSMAHLSITKGQLPPVTTEPNPATEVWTMDNLQLNNSFYVSFEEIYKFHAQIGDVIGVFCSTGTSNVVSGFQMGTVISNLTATFTIESPVGDLDGDGDVDFYDFAELANNWLKSIP